jgi:hypothetical protein
MKVLTYQESKIDQALWWPLTTVEKNLLKVHKISMGNEERVRKTNLDWKRILLWKNRMTFPQFKKVIWQEVQVE